MESKERKRDDLDLINREQNLLCRKLTDWENEPSYADVATSAYPKCLVQFWRAEEVAISANDFRDRRFQLTTRNQPFILCGYSSEKPINQGICLYRMKTRDVIIIGDGRGGPISRVFKNNRIEVTPNVAYYSYEEYPQRDTALSCLLNCSLIVPLSDSCGRTVGVMEFVSQSNWSPIYFMDRFLPILPESDLMYLDPCKGLCGQYDLDKDSLRSAVSEIKEVIGVLFESFDIVFGQTWMLCEHCNSLSTSKRCAKELGASYERFIEDRYVKFGYYCTLREGEGVVGRAAMSSYNLVYCENVAKFSITEYPLAHFVRKDNLSASFAICLQSNLSGDQVYVLEFLLGRKSGNWGLRMKLVPILDKMRQCFRTFKVAYGGEEIGDKLFVQVIDASSPDKVETLTIDSTLAIGVKNVEAFYLPYYFGESSRNEKTSFQDISMDDVPVASASTIQSEICVTVKANYGGDFVTFQLFSSSGILELNRQVSRRLEITEGTYDLSYRDEDNDLILLTCDEDLQLFISSSTKQGNYTVLVLIEPRCALLM